MQWFPRSRALCRSVPPQQRLGKLEDHGSAEGRQQGGRSPCQDSGDRGMWCQPLCRVGREHPSTIRHCTEGGSWKKLSPFTDFHKKGIKMTE